MAMTIGPNDAKNAYTQIDSPGTASARERSVISTIALFLLGNTQNGSDLISISATVLTKQTPRALIDS